jgi:4-hydroxybenzoate polyprenyltransferase
MNKLLLILALIRPKQWIKNFFIFAPLVFAKELFQLPAFLVTARAFAAFCLTASSVYIINDIVDVEADRSHPEKKKRPLAAGTLSRNDAFVALFVLVVLDVLLMAGFHIHFILFLALYFVLNIAYTFGLKEVVLLDVFIIAAGFMFRVLGGAVAIDVQVSSWIVLCSLFISLFLGFAKRRGELATLQEMGIAPERKVLQVYRVDFIDQMLTIAAAGAVISYALYAVAPRTIEIFGTDKMIYTTVFVLYGVFRYLYLIHTSPRIENPTNAVTSDPTILVTGLLWITTCILLIYWG